MTGKGSWGREVAVPTYKRVARGILVKELFLLDYGGYPKSTYA